MTPFINGLGVVASTGRGVDSLRASLQVGWRPPVTIPLREGRDLPVYMLPPGILEITSFA